jgi:hypothetical protein
LGWATGWSLARLWEGEGKARKSPGEEERREIIFLLYIFPISKILCNVSNYFWFSNLFWNIQNMGWTYQHIL